MTFGRLYDTVKERYDDPEDEKYDRLCPPYSKHLVKTISDQARDDLKDEKGVALKPKTPESLIEEATEQIALLDAKVKKGKGPQYSSDADPVSDADDSEAMGSPAPSDASFEAMDEDAKNAAMDEAEELRRRIEDSEHPQLDALDGLTKAKAADLAYHKGNHISLSVRDTPKWVAKHLFGSSYNEKRDGNLKLVKLFFN